MSTKQEDHLDRLIREAWEAEDELTAQSLASQPEESLPPVDDMTMKRAFAMAQKKMDAAGSSRPWRRWVQRCVNAAAAVILTVAVGLTAALAASESLRAEALRLLVSLDAGRGVVEITLIKPDVAAMNIPDAWTGTFFPSVLPEGTRMTDCRMWSRGGNHQITFKTPDGRKIVFSELHGSMVTEYGIEGAMLSYAEVNGNVAFVRYLEEGPIVGIDWANDVCWLALHTEGMTQAEALEIAESVVYIQ